MRRSPISPSDPESDTSAAGRKPVENTFAEDYGGDHPPGASTIGRIEMTKTDKSQSTVSRAAGTAAQVAEGAKTISTVATSAKIGLGLLGIVQVAFAFLAFWDLAWRDPKEVRGPKPAWIPAILINWIGPAAYFLVGIRHRR